MAIAAPPRPTVSRVYRRLMERLPIRYADMRRVGGAVGPLRFNQAQEELWKIVAPRLDAQERIRLIVLKARQEGVSTFTQGLIMATTVFTDYAQSLVVAQDKTATSRIWGMARMFVDHSPLRMIAKPVGHEIKCRHASITLATAGTPEAARSGQLTCLHGSELAFPRWTSQALLAMLQCLPRSRDVFSIAVIESTANGMADDGQLFYDHWTRACEGETSFIPVFLPYQTFPQYCDPDQTPLTDLRPDEVTLLQDLHLSWGQLRWRRRVMADECEGDVNLFNQEYPATPEMAFIMSGMPFFPPEKLIWLEPHIYHPQRGGFGIRFRKITWEPDDKGAFRLFKPPQPGHSYLIGADSSMGIDDKDHSRSAMEVLDMDTLEQVAEYEAPAPPHVFAKDMALLGKVYNNALLVPEIQSSGGGGGTELLVYLRQDWHYHNIHRWYRADTIRKRPAIVYGWETNSKSKPRMLARLQEVMRERSSVIHSRALVRQLRAYGKSDTDKMEALAGHDDLVMAYGIGLVSRSENWVNERQQDVRQSTQVNLERLGYSMESDPDATAQRVFQEMMADTWQDRSSTFPADLLAW